MTTLQEDILKASNQGKPGYDVLGNPVATSSPATSTPSSVGLSSYLPSVSSDQQAIDTAQKAEVDRLAGLATPETESERRARITSGFQSEIDALNAVYAQQKQEAIQRGMGRLGSDTAIQARRGLIGSTFGAGQTANVESANTADVQAVEAEKAKAMAGVFARIQEAVATAATEKQKAQSTSAAANLEYLKSIPERKAQLSNDFIKNLLASNVEFKKEDLDKISSQLVSLGLDPEKFRADYITAAQAKVAELKAQQTAQDKTNREAAKPFAVGDYTWQWENGSYVNKGTNQTVKAPTTTDGLTTRQNIVLNQLLTQNNTIDKANNTFRVVKETSDRLEAEPSNPQLQLSMLYQYVKVLDSNSAVREGETQLAKDTASFYEKAQTMYEGVKSGTTVGADVALKMSAEAKKLAESWLNATQSQQNNLRAQARANKIEQNFVDTIDYAKELNGMGQSGTSDQTPTTTKSGQPFDVAGAKAQGYTDEEIQAYLNSN